MPTLIRLFVVLLVLAGLVLAGMIALAVFVQPTEKEIRVRIPPQQLGVETSNDPLGIRTPPPAVEPVPTTTTAVPPAAAPADPDITDVDIPE